MRAALSPIEELAADPAVRVQLAEMRARPSAPAPRKRRQFHVRVKPVKHAEPIKVRREVMALDLEPEPEPWISQAKIRELLTPYTVDLSKLEESRS